MLPPLPITCLDPLLPSPTECQTTRIFGAPKGTPGRNNIPISGIVIHGIQDSYDGYLSKMCVDGRMAVNCHASMHYVIDAESGRLSSAVAPENLAWAFQSYRTNFPVTTPRDCCICPTPCPQPPCPTEQCEEEIYAGWTTLPAMFPNLSADFYTINIGVTLPSRPEQTALDGVNCCIGPYGMSDDSYARLVQLVAYLAFTYDIEVSDETIIFHDALVATDEQCLEFPCGPNGVCFVCDVDSYCQRCPNRGDPSLSPSTTVLWVYGETQGGCRVKVLLSDLQAMLNALP